LLMECYVRIHCASAKAGVITSTRSENERGGEERRERRKERELLHDGAEHVPV